MLIIEEEENNIVDINLDILKNITFHLCDINKDIVDEWESQFEGINNFKFYCSDIFKCPVSDKNINAIVSPANSFGDLQGGIDLVYYNYFGHNLEERLQKTIMEEKYGELIIGDSIMLSMNGIYNYFISAPTMKVPMIVSKSNNAYLAFRAVLIKLIEFNKISDNPITDVICPGLGTSIGKISAENCAKQMLDAYSIMIRPDYHLDLMKKSCEHYSMCEYH
jgi:O-acetyl-ADP-ribose deacetylase (regulator of RNase III)